MTSRFSVALPLELAFNRRVAMAAEIVDGVTLLPVTSGLMVSATGLRLDPIVNSSGYYVWLEEEDREAQDIVVEVPPLSPYRSARATSLALPEFRRIELSPTERYRFSPGVTALRGTLRESRYGTPRPVAEAKVRLQWSGDSGWTDAPLASISAASGDFGAALRLGPSAEPRELGGGAIAVRLLVRRDTQVRTSAEIALRQGTVTSRPEPFVWDELQP